MKKLSLLIRLARKKKSNMPMVTVAEKAGISYGVMQKIEAGTMKTYPEKDLLLKICDLLDINYDEAVDSLYDFKKEAKYPESSITASRVPVIEWNELFLIKEGKSFSTFESEDRVVSNIVSKDLIGVCYSNPIHQVLGSGPSILIIEQTSHITHMDTVLFYNSDIDDFEIRIFEQSKKGGLLRSSSPASPTVFLTTDNKQHLYGVVVEVVSRLKV
jgi:transcriptional regulator with XRE-family HTH domain